MTIPESAKLNPQITDVDIGVRDLRTIKIYPLSLKDEKLFGDVFQQTLQKYFDQPIGEGDDQAIATFATFMLKLIEENFVKILGLITDKEEKGQKLFDSMTSMQASEIVMSVYRTNFEDPLKNVESLLEKIKGLFQSRRLSPLSLNDTDNTTLPTSTVDLSGTEDLPEDSS